MKYSISISSRQVANTHEDFNARQGEAEEVFCVGETTKSKSGVDSLIGVPLNYTYDRLKPVDKIVIFDVPDEPWDYSNDGACVKVKKGFKEIKTEKILDANSKEAIDYVFKEVNNSHVIKNGYIQFLSDEMKEYFKSKLSNE